MNEGDGREPDDRRRRLLGYAAMAALGGSGVVGAWYTSRPDDPPESTPTESPGGTATTRDQPEPVVEVPELVERFAPDLYFGALEEWYPTDPRAYVVETGEGRVVDRVATLDAYTAAFVETGDPPAPMVFYNVVSSLETALEILLSDGQGGYSDASVAALEPRIRAAIDRTRTTIETDLA